MADTIRIRLSPTDHELVVSALDLPSAARSQLSAGVLEGDLRRFDLSPDIIDELLEAIEFTAVATRRHKLQRSLARLHEDLLHQTSQSVGLQLLMDDGLESMPPSDLATAQPGEWADDAEERSAQLQARVAELFRSHSFSSQDEAEKAIQELVDQANRHPLSDLDGLTPLAAHVLFDGDWSADTPGLQLRDNLPMPELEGATIIHNARAFLRAIGEKGTQTTAKGNLNRVFVAEMVETLQWPAGFVDDLYRYNKVINESDVWPLEVLRINLNLAGLVRKYKGRFVVTRRGRDLLADGRAGELMALLFRTWFQKFNLSYGDRLAEYPEFQRNVAYSFWQLSRLPAGWQRLEAVMPKLLHPGAVPSIPELDYYDFRPFLVHARLIKPLENFGLVECDHQTTNPPHPVETERFRRRPLFAEFLRFALPD